jgi:hypothetical protein
MSDDRAPKDAWQEGALGGTLLRGKDGSLYFIRDELLEALRVGGEGSERLDEALKASHREIESFTPSKDATEKAPVATTGYVRGSLLRQDPRNAVARLPNAREVAASTIMCPWFCGHPTGPLCW